MREIFKLTKKEVPEPSFHPKPKALPLSVDGSVVSVSLSLGHNHTKTQ